MSGLDISGHQASAAWELVGRRVVLRELRPNDVDFLYSISTASTTAFRWRFRGGTPAPDTFIREMWSNVLAQFMVTDKKDGRPLGLVVCSDPNFLDGYAYLAAVVAPQYVGTGALVEAVALFIFGVFRNWNFRKLYMEAPEFNVDQVRSGLGGFFHEEGRLQAHRFYNGHYHDQLILALYRDEYEQMAPFIHSALGIETEEEQTIVDAVRKDTGIAARRTFSAGVPDLDEFCVLLAEEFERPLEWVTPDAYLTDDIGLDSLEMAELSIILDEIVGPRKDVYGFVKFTTVRELWLYLMEISSMPPGTVMNGEEYSMDGHG